MDRSATRLGLPVRPERLSLKVLMALLDVEGAHLVELHLQKATLEDIFIELTGTDLRD